METLFETRVNGNGTGGTRTQGAGLGNGAASVKKGNGWSAEFFKSNGHGHGYGDGSGNGGGNGDGNGNGDGYGDGYGYGEGNGASTHIGNGLGYGEMFLLDPIIAYHRPASIIKMRYEHGKRSLFSGEPLNAGDDIELCHWGLHACLNAKDTETYSNGILTKVLCSGAVRFGRDKLVCEHRVVEVIC